MLEIKNLTGGYVHVPVLKDVSFTVESGQLVGLIGLNGAGKSTTINEIIGLLTPYSIEQKVAFERVEPLLKMFRLDQKLDWFPVHFSKGMKQKVMIICAFVVDPSLFIVDEPFLGLDPLAISDLIQLLEVEKQKGKSILMSTHVLDSAEKMCDAFVILHKGEVRAKGNLLQLREAFDMQEASLNDIYLALTKEEEL